ncbi:MAG: hypothetical protein R3A80_02805 [Bdellovibrionota bacterium]
MKKLGMIGILFLASCGAGNGVKSSSGQTPRVAEQNSEWAYEVEYEKPEVEGGLWKRSLRLLGSVREDVAIDKMKEGQSNWTEVGFTDEEGIFFDEESLGKVRYRINGETTTEWMNEERDLMITSIPESRVIEGLRCILPQGVTVYIGTENLEIRCGEVIVRGSLRAFVNEDDYRRNVYSTKAPSSGDLLVDANELVVNGLINLQGHIGRSSGDGGDITLNYKTIRMATDSVRADSGPQLTPPPNHVGVFWRDFYPGLAGTVTYVQK